jgi:serine protease
LALGAFAALGFVACTGAIAPALSTGATTTRSRTRTTSAAQSAERYLPGVVVAGFQAPVHAQAQMATARAAGAQSLAGSGAGRGTENESPAGGPAEGAVRVVHLRPGVSVSSAIAHLVCSRGVDWAVPDYVAHATATGAGTGTATIQRLANASATERSAASANGATETPASELTERSTALAPVFIPNNTGNGKSPGEWQALQWNFVGANSVEAEQAWGNVIADHGEGGHGVIVAVLDTGVAYRDWGSYRRSPGFSASEFVRGYDFVNPKSPPVDRNGHGTFVAGEIAEETNIPYGLPGLAYGARLMPVRVLDGAGEGDAVTIAKGINYAVEHHANIINLSLEFPAAISAADVPELIQALRNANSHHVLVVAAAGNDSSDNIPYPARALGVLAIGATSEHGCLADYSNFGRHISMVAPGGGPDATLPGDPNCHPEVAPGRDIFQVTYVKQAPGRFGLPGGYEGTSMATPEVAATAALVIASGVLGPHPTPKALAARLRATARPLGGSGDRALYGAGLLDAAAATAPGGPGAVASTER